MNYKLLTEDISNWIKDYTLSNKLDTLHIGVSGGIDSAVVSTLCAKTGLPTYCYGIPILSHKENNRNSEIQLNWLKKNYPNVTVEIKDLTSVFITFKNGLNLTDLSKANTKSRLRMVYLYAMAGNLNGLVVGTGNKVEDFGVGFYTKYGDGGVDISPIADLTKTQVWGLAKYLGIPQEIQDASPTDGLWDNPEHNDQAQIGATYPELEWAMGYISSPDYNLIDLTDRQKEVLSIYLKFHNKNKHKMLPISVFKVEHSKYQNKTQQNESN